MRSGVRHIGWALRLMAAIFLGMLATQALVLLFKLEGLAAAATFQGILLLVGLLLVLTDRMALRDVGVLTGRRWSSSDWSAIPLLIGIQFGGSMLTAMFMALAGQADMEGQPATELFGRFLELGPGVFLAVALGLALLSGLAEELLFRGYLIARLERMGFSAVVCVGLTALVFGLVHWDGYGLYPSLSKALWFGVPTGIYFWRRRRLGPLILAHAAINFIGFISLYFVLPMLPVE